MKTAKFQHLLAAMLLAGAMLTGCSKDNSLTEIITPDSQEQTSDAIVQALEAIDGVSAVRVETDEIYEDKIYFFSFRQLIDHENPDVGTFEQQVALNFKGFDKNVVLYTHGYTMSKDVDDMRPVDLRDQLDANQVNVEHRYFGNSLPEASDNMKFTYFNAKQQAQDLHAIVQALKKNMFKTGKWASTGTSKDGITTALYAYYSDMYGWQDIDVFVPFCAPFLTGTFRDGEFTCMDPKTGAYLEDVCGSGYADGTVEAIAYQRLRDIPRYICSNEKVRDAAIKSLRVAAPSTFRTGVEQYSQHSPFSTGDLTKDLTAIAYYTYYDNLYSKFSYVPFTLWARFVPDPAKAVTDDEELQHLCLFMHMDRDVTIDSLRSIAANASPTRSSLTDAYDKYWQYIIDLRDDEDMPYHVQSFMELGAFDHAYNTVDGIYLTKEQAINVNEIFSTQSHYKGLYKQDKGQLMRDFLEWVGTETTQKIIFVYAHNDAWTGGRPDDTAVLQNPNTEMVIDFTSVHTDSFLNSSIYTTDSKNAIIAALNRFLK